MAKLVWVVAVWGRMVVMAAEKSDCSLLLIGPGGASAYTITDTELNVNFAAESLEKTLVVMWGQIDSGPFSCRGLCWCRFQR